MIVTGVALAKYRNKLSAINNKAAELVQQYMLEHNFDIDDAFLSFANEIVAKYGEAAGALSAQFYDELHEYWAKISGAGVKIKAAEIADLPTQAEVAKTIYGTMTDTAIKIPGSVSRLVKRVAEDTTLKNAIRDGAEFAWIPAGDTCSFCIMLASNGWQTASDKALKGGHAEHIHSNCDCTYTIRFDDDMSFADYDPDVYLEMYENADGNSWQEKVRAMDREKYKANADEIRERKRIEYAKRNSR